MWSQYYVVIYLPSVDLSAELTLFKSHMPAHRWIILMKIQCLPAILTSKDVRQYTSVEGCIHS